MAKIPDSMVINVNSEDFQKLSDRLHEDIKETLDELKTSFGDKVVDLERRVEKIESGETINEAIRQNKNGLGDYLLRNFRELSPLGEKKR